MRRSASAASPANQQAVLAGTVQQVIRPWMAEKQPPGVMVVVRQYGGTHFFGFGEANLARRIAVTADSIFELASITKVFCTTSLAMEVDAGRMQLGDSVAEYFPLFAERGGDIRQVTLEQLATHTSSLPRAPGPHPAGGPWTQHQSIVALAQWPAPYPPGTTSLYSNMAVGLLGQAIANREGEPLLAVWERQFLRTLGMTNTFFVIPRDRVQLAVQGYGRNGRPVPHDPPGPWPAGGRLSSSGRDMGQFLAANMGERPDLPKITAAMKLAQKPFFQPSPKMVQGLCWQRVHLQNELVIDKNGGLDGTSTYIGFLPEQHLGVVVMANRGKCEATTVGRQLLLDLVGKQHKAEVGEGAEADNEP